MTDHRSYAEELLPEVVAWRRHLHQNPEIGLQEFETTAYVADLLTRWGVTFRRTTPTGVIAQIQGSRPGPTVALRADMDALPIQEETGLPYASQRAGLMHACGHDGHTAILLGTVRRFLDLNGDFPGTVRFLFQPGEEGFAGARNIIQQGGLEDARAVYGLHLMADAPLGIASAMAGPRMAASDRFTIHVQGRGGHGAMPHATVDAVLVATSIVGALQTIVARRIDPLRPAVVTVGEIHAGVAANVIADTARLTGTCRSFHEDVRETIETSMKEVVEQTARALGAEATLDYRRGSPSLVNHEREAQVMREAAAAVLGPQAVVDTDPIMGGEDFSYYLLEKPGAFLWLGAAPQVQYPHHHPKFAFEESALASGVAILCETALRELEA